MGAPFLALGETPFASLRQSVERAAKESTTSPKNSWQPTWCCHASHSPVLVGERGAGIPQRRPYPGGTAGGAPVREGVVLAHRSWTGSAATTSESFGVARRTI